MNKRQKQLLLRWSLAAVNMLIIFLFSGQNGQDSGELSSFLAQLIRKLPLLGQSIEYFNIRKTAHFTIYLMLGIFMFRAMLLHGKKVRIQAFTALFLCFVYACTDEFHQSFIPGRGPAFADVLIDTCGALAGIGLVMTIPSIPCPRLPFFQSPSDDPPVKSHNQKKA